MYPGGQDYFIDQTGLQERLSYLIYETCVTWMRKIFFVIDLWWVTSWTVGPCVFLHSHGCMSSWSLDSEFAAYTLLQKLRVPSFCTTLCNVLPGTFFNFWFNIDWLISYALVTISPFRMEAEFNVVPIQAGTSFAPEYSLSYKSSFSSVWLLPEFVPMIDNKRCSEI